MSDTSIYIFCPAYGGTLSVETWGSTMALAHALAKNGIPWTASALNYPEPSEARNLALTIWYDAVQTTHMLTIDSDMGFRPQLVLDMLALDVPLVGTVYRHKADEVTFAGSGLPKPGHFNRVADRVKNGRFLEIEGAGMGCTLIRRDCVDAMLETLPKCSDDRCSKHPANKQWLMPKGIKRILRFFDPVDHPERGRLSEDLAFCSRVRAAGVRVWASIGHDVDHVGRKVYTGNYMKHALEHEAREHFASDAQVEAILHG